jgi:hypothetical protein
VVEGRRLHRFEAASGEDAVAHLPNGHQFDFVITDIRLSGLLAGMSLMRSAPAFPEYR